MTSNRHSRFIRPLLAAAVTLALVAGISPTGTGGMARAQGLFSPVVRVNDQIITQFQIDQRARFLQVLNVPGDPRQQARTQLIEDALKLDAARQLGAQVDAEALRAGMAEFAQRADLTTEQFVAELARIGVAEETFQDFIRSQILWRSIVRARFGSRVNIGDEEIDRALANSAGAGSVRVLISEIFIPTGRTQQQAQQAQQIAGQIAQMSTVDAFSAAARQYSAAPSRDQGGHVEWMEITNLPPQLRPIIMALAPGQVTQPLPVEGALALFQLRAMEESQVGQVEYSEIEYAAYYLDGGRSPETLARAAQIEASIDTCNDLYGVAKGQPEAVLERGSKKPGEIPTDIAVELAKLDRHEVSTALTRADGQTLVFLMLCGRTPEGVADLDRAEVAAQLQNQRFASYADGYLSQLRSEARIVEY